MKNVKNKKGKIFCLTGIFFFFSCRLMSVEALTLEGVPENLDFGKHELTPASGKKFSGGRASTVTIKSEAVPAAVEKVAAAKRRKKLDLTIRLAEVFHKGDKKLEKAKLTIQPPTVCGEGKVNEVSLDSRGDERYLYQGEFDESSKQQEIQLNFGANFFNLDVGEEVSNIEAGEYKAKLEWKQEEARGSIY